MDLLNLTLVFGLFIYLFNRIHKLEQSKGIYDSQWLRIKTTQSLLGYEPFLKLVGIKSNLAKKDYDKWTKKEKEIWGKYPSKYVGKMNVKINYLASEDSYLVQPESGKSYLVQRGGTNSIIYSGIIAGDEEGFNPHINLDIYERYVDFGGERKEPAFTICLEYTGKIFNYNYNKNDFKILCDFPIFDLKTDEEFKKLGFEVDRTGADDVYKDSFDEMHSIPLMMNYKKNGVLINRVFN